MFSPNVVIVRMPSSSFFDLTGSRPMPMFQYEEPGMIISVMRKKSVAWTPKRCLVKVEYIPDWRFSKVAEGHPARYANWRMGINLDSQ